jgi:hypothetical protein
MNQYIDVTVIWSDVDPSYMTTDGGQSRADVLELGEPILHGSSIKPSRAKSDHRR